MPYVSPLTVPSLLSTSSSSSLSGMSGSTATTGPLTPNSDVGDEAPFLGCKTSGPLADAVRASLGISPTDEVRMSSEHADAIAGMLHLCNEVIDKSVAEVMRRPSVPPDSLEAQQHKRDLETLEELHDVVHCHIDGAQPPPTTSGTLAHSLNLDLLDRLRAAEDENGGPLTPMTRCEVILDLLVESMRAIINNDSKNPTLRYAANFLHSFVKTGLVTVLPLTVLRQILGMYAEFLLRTHAVGPEVRSVIGLALMLLGPCATIAGLVDDHCTGRGTSLSQGARLLMLATAIGTIVAMYLTDTLSTFAPFGVQNTIYCVGRDFLQLFFNVHDNAPLTTGSSAFSGVGWSLMQGGTSAANDYLAPDSGAGYVMGLNQTFFDRRDAITTALNATSGLDPTEQASAIYDALCNTGQLLQDIFCATAIDTVWRGVFNAIPEIADDQMRQYAALRGSDEVLRVNARLHLPTRDSLRDTGLAVWPGRETIFNNLVGQALVFDAAFGKYLPRSGPGRIGTMAAVTALLSLPNYMQLMLSLQRAPRAPRDRPDVPGVTDPSPAELTGVRRRTSFESVV